jgi:hypothetical protein
MKQIICVALLAALVACGENKPVAVEAVPVTSIEQQNREIAERLAQQKGANEAKATAEAEANDRRRMVAGVQEPTARWIAAYQKISGKRASEIEPMMAEMQAARADLASTSTSPCTDPKRVQVLASMDQVTVLINEFKSSNGNVDAEFPNRIGAAAASVSNASSAVAACTQIQ